MVIIIQLRRNIFFFFLMDRDTRCCDRGPCHRYSREVARNRARTTRSIAHLRSASRINLVCKAADISINPGEIPCIARANRAIFSFLSSTSSSPGFFLPPSIFRLHSSGLLPAIKRRPVAFVGMSGSENIFPTRDISAENFDLSRGSMAG